MPAFVLASASRGLHRPADAGQPDREPAGRLRAHGQGQGPEQPRARSGVHTLRNSLIPVITYIGIDIGALMGGAIVTERIFNINGIGNFLYRSISQKDGTSVVGTIICLVLIYLLVNLIVDILYGFLDPRISHD